MPQLTQRLSVVVLTVCFIVAIYALLASDYFSPKVETNAEIQQLPVQVLSSANDLEIFPSDLHHWVPPASGELKQVHYRVTLPAGSVQPNSAIYIAGFRQAVEVWQGDALLAEGGNQNIQWMHSILRTLMVPLSRVSAAQASNGIELDIFVRAAGIATGGLGSVYFGDADLLDKTRTPPVKTRDQFSYVAIGILSALLVLLAFDAFYSARSKQRFLLTLPHFFFAVQFLPELSFDPPLLWYKLHKLTGIICVMGWASFGMTVLSLPHRWFRPMVVLIVGLSIPYLFIDDITNLHKWVRLVHEPVTIVCCIYVFFFVLFNWRRSTDQKALVMCLTGGSVLMASGLYQQYLFNSGDLNFQLHGFPISSLFSASLIFIWTAHEMLSRGKKLEQHRQQVLSLVASRTRELDKTKIALIQQQRYLNLNSMGAAISHEIKNPLGSLFNDFQLLNRMLAKSQDYSRLPLPRMQRSMERIDDIITKLASYSRKSELTRSVHDYGEWLQAFFADAETQRLLQDIDLELQIPAGPETSFDPELMRRSYLNLLENAVRAVGSQDVKKIQVRVWQSGEQVHTAIIDNGDGFASEELEQLLEPLVSGTGSMGLGLAIVRDTVVLHQGNIELSNNADSGGAQVLVSLPIALL